MKHYKYSRERLSKLYFQYEDKCGFLEDLLSTLPEKEDNFFRCIICNKIIDVGQFYCDKHTPLSNIKESSPSLDGLEEIGEIYKDKTITVNFATKKDLALAIMKTQLKTNSLIRNQRIIIKKLKSL